MEELPGTSMKIWMTTPCIDNLLSPLDHHCFHDPATGETGNMLHAQYLILLFVQKNIHVVMYSNSRVWA